jgi:tellurite resistance protein
MDDKTRQDLANVMVFALVDGEVSDQEKRFIDALRIRLGVSDAELRDLVQQVRINPKHVVVPADAAEAAETVRLLVDLAAADGVIDPAEREVLVKIARRAGMDQATLEGMIGPAGEAAEAGEAQIDARVDEVYARFGAWDGSTRRAKLAEIAAYGRQAVPALIGLMESYRVPDGCGDSLELKALLAEQLGGLGDERAVYYLAQQVNIGDVDDEVTNAALRHAAAEALGQIVGEALSRDQEGVEAARTWWFAVGSRRYDKLAY